MLLVLCNYWFCNILWNDGYVDRFIYYGVIDLLNIICVYYIIEVVSFGIVLICSDYMYYVKYVVMNEVLSRFEI